eukprot:1145507-Alexandrium_andersonii.AAC.2
MRGNSDKALSVPWSVVTPTTDEHQARTPSQEPFVSHSVWMMQWTLWSTDARRDPNALGGRMKVFMLSSRTPHATCRWDL